MRLSRLTKRIKARGTQTRAVMEEPHPVVHPPMSEALPSICLDNAELPLEMETLIPQPLLNQDDWWYDQQSTTNLLFQNSGSYAPILPSSLGFPMANEANPLQSMSLQWQPSDDSPFTDTKIKGDTIIMGFRGDDFGSFLYDGCGFS